MTKDHPEGTLTSQIRTRRKTDDTNEENESHSSNGSTGDQIGGQSPHSEDEMHGRTKGLPKE